MRIPEENKYLSLPKIVKAICEFHSIKTEREENLQFIALYGRLSRDLFQKVCKSIT